MRAWLYRHGVRWHAQNLTGDEHGPSGPMWKAGRAWLSIWLGNAETGQGYRELFEINPEWHLGWRGTFGVGVVFGHGDDSREVMVHADIGVARGYLTLDGLPRSWAESFVPGYWIDPQNLHREERTIHHNKPVPGGFKVIQETEIDLRWHDGSLWWSLWHPTMEWSSRTPKWRHGSFSPADWLLGKPVYTRRDLSTEAVEVPMPERLYGATVQLYEATWRRPRWPFAVRNRLATIEVPGGIPQPGKGENSWDCGEDATYSLSCEARTPAQAVGRMVATVLTSRRNYGGRNWRPEGARAA